MSIPFPRSRCSSRLLTAATDPRDWIDGQFGKLNFFNRALVELRVKLFGKWSLNSLCGRDELGRDLLARLFWGARISLIVGLVATLVSLVIGVSYGAIAGYFGGWVDNLMMRIVDVLYSIPFIFVVIFLVTILGRRSDQSAAGSGTASIESRFSFLSSARFIG